MTPLNLSAVAAEYQAVFELSDQTAQRMAEFTGGFAFAYQVLGYLCFKKKKIWEELVPEFDRYMEEYCYGKVWQECSGNDKRVLKALASSQSSRTAEIQKAAGMEKNVFSVYRARLIRKGILTSKGYGQLELVPPRFAEFTVNTSHLYDPVEE